MRRLITVALALVALWAATGTALGHATLESTTPAEGSSVATSPTSVTLRFSEPVELFSPQGDDVVDENAAPVSTGPPRNGRDRRTIEIPVRPGLPDGTYTVKYSVIGADSHVIPGVFVFGVGNGPVGEAVFAGTGGGPSETGVWGTSARFLEIVGLGGLIGLVAFRWLVWGPAARRGLAAAGADEREAVLGWGRDLFWVAFGALAVGAMLAEGYLLVVQSASALGVSVFSALGDATGIARVLGDTRFGSLVQLRGGLLFGLFALGCVLFLREYGGAGNPRPAEPAASPVVTLGMVALLGGVLGGVAAQGHASVTELPALQIGAQLVHIVAVSVWIAGLALVAIVHLRLRHVASDAGPVVAARVLARFSKVALIAVAVAVATGVVRSIGELGGPAELWETAYGRSIVIKIGLLAPITLIALYNRKIVAALERVSRPGTPTLRLVQRTATAELALSLVIVLIASILVAQVPGGA